MSRLFTGRPSEVASPHDALEVARAFKSSAFYIRVRENHKSFDVVGRRVGASISKEAGPSRIYMDFAMINHQLELRRWQEPLFLLEEMAQLLYENCQSGTHLVDVDVGFGALQRAPQGQYGHINLDFKDLLRYPKILRIVFIGEVIKCVDDTIAELDIRDGVYRP